MGRLENNSESTKKMELLIEGNDHKGTSENLGALLCFVIKATLFVDRVTF